MSDEHATDPDATEQRSWIDPRAVETRPADRIASDPGPGGVATVSESGLSSSGALPRVGDRIGNFDVERELGAGAMGVVLLARDADLGRRVAIKLLRGPDSGSESARQRMLREAQSVAQLQHPNVVALHQVGMHQGSVYLVMEFVDGGTLRQWADAKRRPWREILDAYRQAAQGLAAAHAAGLVHRDFKPDNVLIGKDGRVRVSDFGLVGARGTEETVPELSSGDVRLTQTGTMLGTPAYMAPEQFAGSRVDAAADQFAFCVSLYEALFGRRPFAGDNAGALLLAIEDRELQPPPRGHGVPASIRRAVEKGLDPDPGRRHASMPALIDAITPRRGWGTWAVAGLGVAGVAGLVLTSLDPRAPEPEEPAKVVDCAEPGDWFAPEWTEGRRTALATALRGAKMRDAGAIAQQTLDAAAERARALALLDRDVCLAAAEVDAETLARMSYCATEATAAFGATVDVLSDAPTPQVAAAAVGVMRSQPPLAPCRDPEQLRHRAAPPHNAGPHEDALRRVFAALQWFRAEAPQTALALAEDQLSRDTDDPVIEAWAARTASLAKLRAGDETGAEARARQAIAAARAAADRRLEALTLSQLASVLAEDGRDDEAMATLRQADEAVADAGPEVGYLVSYVTARVHAVAGRHAEAEAAASLGLDTLASLPTSNPVHVAMLQYVRGDALYRLGQLDQAERAFEAGLQAAAALGPSSILRRDILTSLAAALRADGNTAGARERYAQALELLDADPEGNAVARGNIFLVLGDMERGQGNNGAAIEAFDRAIASWDTPATEPRRASALTERGIVEFMLGNNREAEQTLREAAELAERHPGAPEIHIERLEGMGGGVAIALGKLREGLEHHQRALQALEAQLGPFDPKVAEKHVTLGDIAMYMQACDEARASYRRALRIRTAQEMPPDGELVRITTGQATCDAIDGNLEDARDGMLKVERELADERAVPWLGGRLSMIRAEIAYREGDRAAAREHATNARAVYQALGPAHLMDVDHVERWLAAH